MDLTELFPQPTAVAIGGRRLLIAPLTLGQLGELQGWLRRYVPSPADRAIAALASGEYDDSERRRRLLVTAYLDAEKWPIEVGTPAGDYLLSTRAGRRELLRVASGMSAAEVVAIAGAATAAEWSAMERACYPADAIGVLTRLIDPEAFAGEGAAERPAVAWGQLIVRVMEETGWTFAAVKSLTLGQVAAYRSGGKRPDLDVPPRPGETREAANDRRRAYFDLDGEGDGDE